MASPVFDLLEGTDHRLANDEGAEGKLRIKHKLTPQPYPHSRPAHALTVGHACIPRALLTALRLTGGRNRWLTERDHDPAGRESPVVDECLSD